MVISDHVNRLYKNFDRSVITGKSVTTIDSHTEGESTRLIVDGIGDIPGITMMEKLDYFKTNYDYIRTMLTKEPRGSRDILAAAVTRNVTQKAAFGLIYMDAKRYPYLCGHATIGAVATLAQTGYLDLKEGENIIPVDTPSGTMNTRVQVKNGRVAFVAINMVPSFVFDVNKIITVKGFGNISVDLVCTGGFFAMVDTDLLGITPLLENRNILVELGMKIIDAANEQLDVAHPVNPDVNTIDVTEFYDSGKGNRSASGRSMVIYGESHMDRSPCGTGTASKLALLYHYKRIGMHQSYINSSPLGTFFEAELVEKTSVGHFDAFVTRIKGRAWITGIHHFLIEKTDPFKEGFIL